MSIVRWVKGIAAVDVKLLSYLQALKQAVEQSPSGAVIFLPPGRYRVAEMINITKPIILRGAGPNQTTLFFPFSLTEVYGNTPDSSSGYSQWAFRPAFINFIGQDPVGPHTLIATVIRHAAKGTKELVLDSSLGLNLIPGMWIRLVQSEPNAVDSSADPALSTLPHSSLVEHLYGDWNLMSEDVPDHLQARELLGTQYAGQLLAKVVSHRDSVLTLDRALPFNVRLQWSPEVHSIHASLRDAGIESLHIEFAAREYAGHFKEAGYNALYFSAAHDCWVRDVHISNADYGIGLNSTHFCTLQDIKLFDSVPRGNGNGHHGIDISYGSDNLVTQFTFHKEFLHDLSIEWYTHGNVFSDGIGSDLNLDHHRGAPFGNLFSDLQLGKGTRVFESSGAHGRGPHSGAFNTYWNMGSDHCWNRPNADFGHNLTLAGTWSDADCSRMPDRKFARFVFPRNLHTAMLLQQPHLADQDIAVLRNSRHARL